EDRYSGRRKRRITTDVGVRGIGAGATRRYCRFFPSRVSYGRQCGEDVFQADCALAQPDPSTHERVTHLLHDGLITFVDSVQPLLQSRVTKAGEENRTAGPLPFRPARNRQVELPRPATLGPNHEFAFPTRKRWVIRVGFGIVAVSDHELDALSRTQVHTQLVYERWRICSDRQLQPRQRAFSHALLALVGEHRMF